MLNIVKRFIRDDKGASALEYGLLAALIAAVITVSVGALGTTMDTKFKEITAALGGAGGAASSSTSSGSNTDPNNAAGTQP